MNWLCLPNFSNPSVFARILDPEGGRFSIRPSGAFTTTRRYLPGTAVLETTFETQTGCMRLTDCLPVVDGISKMRPLREVLRIVDVVSGNVELQAVLSPRCDYARLLPKARRHGRLGWSFDWRAESLRILSDTDFRLEPDGLCSTTTLNAGERRYFSLTYSQGEIAVMEPLGADAEGRLAETVAWWQAWSAQVIYKGPFRDAVLRSALTLKLMTFVLSGAVIAAPTTSLPEVIGGSRNWDYRFCWLRDAGYTMEALIGLGIADDAEAFLRWLLHATRLTWPKLQIMYDVYGRTNLLEAELTHLAGYRGSQPVRIGNGAHDQIQLDVYGEVIHAAHAFSTAGGIIEAAGARLLAGLGATVRNSWQEPDSGIWEKRGPRQHYTFSKIMCWVAIDKLLDLHKRGIVSLDGDIALYQREKVAIGDLVEERGFNRDIGAYTKLLDGDLLDASLLLIANVGYRTADDPQVRSTFALISDRLGRNGLLSRYEPEPGDRRKPEGSFGICNFWAVEQLALRGDLAEAERQFSLLLSYGNDVGLFAEEIDVETGDALGNFPQAFTHVGLINAALAIERARQNQR